MKSWYIKSNKKRKKVQESYVITEENTIKTVNKNQLMAKTKQEEKRNEVSKPSY